METKFFIFILIAELFTWLGMHFPPFYKSRFEFVRELWICGLCSRVWVYSFLSFIMGEVLFGDLFYLPVISELATGGILAFVFFLAEIGFKEHFLVINIE